MPEEKYREFSKQEILVLLQTLYEIVDRRFGLRFMVAAVTPTFPTVRIHHQEYTGRGCPQALNQIYIVGAIMLALIAIHTVCSYFVDYRGHMIRRQNGSEIRADLFDHTIKACRSASDEQNGQLMTHMTTDIFGITGLFHHGPEDIVISLLKFVGAFVILLTINVELTLITFLFLPIMAGYTYYFNKRAEHRPGNKQGSHRRY